MKNFKIDRVGIGAIFLTALLSPCCFPLFAFGASAFGLSAVEIFGSWTMPLFLSLVGLFLFGLVLSYRMHRCLYPLMVAVPGGVSIFYGYFAQGAVFIYVGMFVLLASAVVNYYRNKLHGNGDEVELVSEVTCPYCGHKKEEAMPVDACSYFYECTHCKKVIKPKYGDCCVFCSYGTVPCPPVQRDRSCCT